MSAYTANLAAYIAGKHAGINYNDLHDPRVSYLNFIQTFSRFFLLKTLISVTFTVGFEKADDESEYTHVNIKLITSG
jgi:hypothetical protein